MMGAQWAAPLVAAVVAAVVALGGNHWLQNRVARRIRDADEVKARLYAFFSLVAEYWLGEARDPTLEARLVAAQLIVITELEQMRYHSRRLRRWFLDTQVWRGDIVDATGGGFQQSDGWEADPTRVRTVARAIGRIIQGLRKAC